MVGGCDRAQLGDDGSKEYRVGDLRKIRESESDKLDFRESERIFWNCTLKQKDFNFEVWRKLWSAKWSLETK